MSIVTHCVSRWTLEKLKLKEQSAFPQALPTLGQWKEREGVSFSGYALFLFPISLSIHDSPKHLSLAAPSTAALLDPGKETESSRHTLYLKAPGKHNIQLCCCRSEAGRMPWRRLLSSSDNQCNSAGISLSTERLSTMSDACPVLPSGVRVTREHRETATSFYAPVPGIAPEIQSMN